jgi:hypothetical protein
MQRKLYRRSGLEFPSAFGLETPVGCRFLGVDHGPTDPKVSTSDQTLRPAGLRLPELCLQFTTAGMRDALDRLEYSSTSAKRMLYWTIWQRAACQLPVILLLVGTLVPYRNGGLTKVLSKESHLRSHPNHPCWPVTVDPR